jgi:hypothetical protein
MTDRLPLADLLPLNTQDTNLVHATARAKAGLLVPDILFIQTTLRTFMSAQPHTEGIAPDYTDAAFMHALQASGEGLARDRLISNFGSALVVGLVAERANSINQVMTSRVPGESPEWLLASRRRINPHAWHPKRTVCAGGYALKGT